MVPTPSDTEGVVMALQLDNLDEFTRTLMVEELEIDVANGDLYLSQRLNHRGHVEYEQLLRTAFEEGDYQSLADDIRSRGLLNATEQRQRPKGGYSTASVPVNAPETLAEGEFNRFYIRALCRRAIDDGVDTVKIYRAKTVATPRSESQAIIGQRIDATALLHDLRTNQGVNTSLGLPPGPNSGLSVRL